MKLIINRTPQAKRVVIPKDLLAFTGLDRKDALEFHGADSTLVALPASMNAMGMVNAIAAMHELATTLWLKLLRACGNCEGCELCDHLGLGTAIFLPPDILEDAGLPLDCKLTASIGDDGAIIVEKAEHDHDLTDVPEYMLESLRKCGICLYDLEELLKDGDILYDATEKEEECQCADCQEN